jgi:hypothetical protein
MPTIAEDSTPDDKSPPEPLPPLLLCPAPDTAAPEQWRCCSGPPSGVGAVDRRILEAGFSDARAQIVGHHR